MQRMTKTSKQNLIVADRVEIHKSDDMELYFVRLWRGDKMAYLSSSVAPINYDSIQHARRAIKRIRPDLEPTTI